jgi:response regulator RpfG family c-di-GMP phosphodiesterase
MKNILILDDDEGPLNALSEALENDYNILTAQTIKAAQIILEDKQSEIDLLITDYHLGKSGTASDLINYLKTNELLKIRNLPVIVTSADSSQKWSVESQNSVFISKPFRISQIHDVIKSKIDN